MFFNGCDVWISSSLGLFVRESIAAVRLAVSGSRRRDLLLAICVRSLPFISSIFGGAHRKKKRDKQTAGGRDTNEALRDWTASGRRASASASAAADAAAFLCTAGERHALPPRRRNSPCNRPQGVHFPPLL